MPIEVEGPDGAVIEFPDNTDQTTIRRVMAQRYNKGQTPKPAPKPKQQERSFLGDLGAAAANTLAGVAQGVTAIPDAIQSGGNALLRMANNVKRGGGAAILDAVGNDRAAANLRREQRIFDRMYSEQAQRTAGDAIERISPTPNTTTGRAVRFGAQMVGGALVPVGPKATTPMRTPRPAAPAPARTAAQEVVEQGQQRGVRVMTSDVRPPRTFMGKAAQKLGESIPLAGTGGQRAAQQTQRIEAAKDLLAEYGIREGADLFDDAGNTISDVAENLIKTRGNELGALTRAKTSVLNRFTGSARTPQAIREIDKQIAYLQGIGDDSLKPVIAKLEGWKANLQQGKTLVQLEDVRKLIGQTFDDPSLANIRGVAQPALQKIYGPLRADMGNFIRAKGGDAAFGKWKGANDRLAAMAGELRSNTMKGVLRNADNTPETVSRLLFSNKPSDVARLYQGLDDVGRAKARSAILFRALEKSGGLDKLSPDRFASNIVNLGKSSGVFFRGAERAELQGFARLMQATQRAGEAAVSTPTGQQVLPYAIPAVLTQLFGLQGGVAVAGGAGVLARVYESAAVRNALVKVAASPQGSRQEAIALERVGTAIASALAANKDKIAAVANDPVGVPLAASDGQEQQ